VVVFSDGEHFPSPQDDISQSAGQFAAFSLLSQTPLPQAPPQSEGQDARDSPESQTPLPHLLWGQSPGQEVLVSPVSQSLLPQVLAGRQSLEQLAAVSPLSHLPLPQLALQSFLQVWGDSAGSHLRSPQTPTAGPAAPSRSARPQPPPRAVTTTTMVAKRQRTHPESLIISVTPPLTKQTPHQ
jgi:hypothetical protein